MLNRLTPAQARVEIERLLRPSMVTTVAAAKAAFEGAKAAGFHMFPATDSSLQGLVWN